MVSGHPEPVSRLSRFQGSPGGPPIQDPRPSPGALSVNGPRTERSAEHGPNLKDGAVAAERRVWGFFLSKPRALSKVFVAPMAAPWMGDENDLAVRSQARAGSTPAPATRAPPGLQEREMT